MGTRSRIGILRENGKIETVYCHFDGYYEGVGKKLAEHYQDKDKIERLIRLGAIIGLKEYPKECETMDDEPLIFNSAEEFAGCEEYTYFFDPKKSEWLALWCYDKQQKFLPLNEAIKRQEELYLIDAVEYKLKEISPAFDVLKKLYELDDKRKEGIEGLSDFLARLNESKFSLDSVSFPSVYGETRAEFFEKNKEVFTDFVKNEADSLGQTPLEFLEKNLKIELSDLLSENNTYSKLQIIDAFIYNNALMLTEEFENKYGVDIEEAIDLVMKENSQEQENDDSDDNIRTM